MLNEIDVRLTIGTVPTLRGEHIAVKDTAGVLLWHTGEPLPNGFRVSAGDLLMVTASIPPTKPGRPRIKDTWQLVAESGAQATLHLGLEGHARPLHRLDIGVSGARKLGFLR